MKQYEVIGLCPVSMFSAIQVLDIDNVADKVVFRWVTSEEYGRPTKSKIRYNEQGEPFFNTKGMSIPFSEVIRKGTPWFN